MPVRRFSPPSIGSPGESGHLLLILMVGLTVAAILLTALVQQWSVVEHREREEELIFRGNQYVKAIRLYQMEHGGALPTSLEILVKPGPRRLRYIRKLFKDPFAPDGKWGILLADPTGKGYINPNAPPPDQQAVAGLEDLGKGFASSSLEQKLKTSNRRNEARQKVFYASSGFSPASAGSFEVAGENSVTAPGQPQGPIVGVVSLYDRVSFRRYKEHENIDEWVFHIFDLPGQAPQKQGQANFVPTPGSGIGPGGSQTIFGGSKGAVGGSAPNPFGNQTPGAFGAPTPPKDGTQNPTP